MIKADVTAKNDSSARSCGRILKYNSRAISSRLFESYWTKCEQLHAANVVYISWINSQSM